MKLTLVFFLEAITPLTSRKLGQNNHMICTKSSKTNRNKNRTQVSGGAASTLTAQPDRSWPLRALLVGLHIGKEENGF